MTVAINITSLTGQRTVFIDTVSKNQVSPVSSNGIALLRYMPAEIGSVQGDVYADTEDMIRYSPFTVECDFVAVDYVNIYCSKVDPSNPAFNPSTDWIKVGEKLDTSGILEFELLDTDFTAGDDIWVKVEDFDNSDIYDIDSSTITASITISSIPASEVVDTDFTISGTSVGLVGKTITIYGKKSTDAWTSKVTLGTATVQADGTWEVTDAQIPSTDFAVSDTVNVRAEYGSTVSSEESMTVDSSDVKYQITSTDCDFDPYSSVKIGTDKIAVLGIANNFSTTPTIGGVGLGTIGSFTSKAIVALIDMSDGSVDWLKYVDPATGNTDVQLPRKSCQSIGTDGTNIITLIDETASLKIFKHTIADGTASNSSAIQSGTWTYPYSSLSVLGSDVFVALNYNSSNDTRLNKYDIATLSQQNTLNIYADISPYYPMVISNDGTDVYVMGRSGVDVKIVKYNSSCVKQSETTLTPTADNRRIMGLAFDGTTQIYSTKESESATQYVLDQYPVTNDGSNSNTNYAGKIQIENSNYFLTNNGTSAFGFNNEPTAQRLNTSDMSTTWNKDYTSDGVDSCIGLHYAGSNYFAVFEVSGDFDGSHSGNTNKCLAFAKVDDATGAI